MSKGAERVEHPRRLKSSFLMTMASEDFERLSGRRNAAVRTRLRSSTCWESQPRRGPATEDYSWPGDMRRTPRCSTVISVAFTTLNTDARADRTDAEFQRFTDEGRDSPGVPLTSRRVAALSSVDVRFEILCPTKAGDSIPSCISVRIERKRRERVHSAVEV